MKSNLCATAVAAAIAFAAIAPRANAAAGDSISFKMIRSAGAAVCLSDKARGTVTISDTGQVQNMHVEVFPPTLSSRPSCFRFLTNPLACPGIRGISSLTTRAVVSEISQGSSVSRPSSTHLASHPLRKSFRMMPPVIRQPLRYRSITWESGSQIPPIHKRLVAATS